MLSAGSSSSQLGIWLVVVVVPHTNPSAANPLFSYAVWLYLPLRIGSPLLSRFLRPTMFHVPEGLRFLESQSASLSAVPEMVPMVPPFESYSFWKLVQGFVHVVVVVSLGGRPVVVVVQLVWFVTPSIMMFPPANKLMALRCTSGPLTRILLGVQPVGKVTFPPPPPPPPAPPSNIASIVRVA